jgi:putative ATPase
MHLKDAHYIGAAQLGVGGYKYPHNYDNHYVKQEYLPKELHGKIYYNEQNNKYEESLKKYWENIKK